MEQKVQSDSARSAHHKKAVAAEVASTLEWLIIAFILAFVFRAFIMEAYRIPTGSMADTLMGAHFRLCCTQCGYKYEYGFWPEKYGLSHDMIPEGELKSYVSRCPSCGFLQPTGGLMPVINGDRILVLKSIYQFLEPHRWDVIVFKNPQDPQINYIKRLIALPGESVAIIDGDIYINGEIRRKPAKVQDELWMTVYDNDYLPSKPDEAGFNGSSWRQPFRNTEDSRWGVDANDPTRFVLDSSSSHSNMLIYDTSRGNNFRATYAYDDIEDYSYMPYCSDLMTRFCVDIGDSRSSVGAELSKYRHHYRGWYDSGGELIIAEADEEGRYAELVRKKVGGFSGGKAVFFSFANVDRQLVLRFGEEEVSYDLGGKADSLGPLEQHIEPKVGIFGSGRLGLSHVGVFRDIHYTEVNNPGPGRALPENPFVLAGDEYFVLGDNSPSSSDSRWWDSPGRANNGRFFRAGIVPQEYLVGKALFVYWPGGFRIFDGARLPVAPNVGGMRLIHGGMGKGF